MSLRMTGSQTVGPFFRIVGIVILIASVLVLRSHLSIAKFGWSFFKGQSWDPVSGNFGALPFIFGTLATSFLALLMAVPLALGVAICRKRRANRASHPTLRLAGGRRLQRAGRGSATS